MSDAETTSTPRVEPTAPPATVSPATVPAPAPAAPSASNGLLSKVGTSLLVSLVVFSLILNVYLGWIVSQFVSGSEAVFQEGETEQRVVILPVVGTIDDEMSRFVRGALRDLDADPPAAIVLRVESGGGGVTASDQIWHGLKTFREEHPDVPIVASFGGIAASGGYYISAGADRIFCEPTGFTGSIGVIAQVPTLEGTMQKLGVEMVTQTADGSPRKAVANNVFDAWSEEDRQVLGYLINSAYDRFVEVVAQGRTALELDALKTVANGDIFVAADALSNGLIDGVGYLGSAIDEAATLANLPPDLEPRVTVVRPASDGLLALLTGQRRAAAEAWTPHRLGGGIGGLAGLGREGLTPQRLRSFLQDFSQVEVAYRWAGR